MSKLNNKGQSLVMFIIIIPVLLFILVAVVDIGNFVSEKENLNSINSLVIDYGLSKIGEDDLENKLIDLLLLNDENINSIDVFIINDGEIKIEIKKNVKGTLTSIFDLNIMEVKSNYIGKIANGKKRIEKVKNGEADG